MIGASIALNISDIPFDREVGAVKVGLVDGKIILNPGLADREKSKLDLTVAATYEKVCMIEAGASEVPDDVMLQAIKDAHAEIKNLCKFIAQIKAEIGKPKATYKSFAIPEDMWTELYDNFYEAVHKAVQTVS